MAVTALTLNSLSSPIDVATPETADISYTLTNDDTARIGVYAEPVGGGSPILLGQTGFVAGAGGTTETVTLDSSLLNPNTDYNFYAEQNFGGSFRSTNTIGPEDVLCFALGTRIGTPAGEVPVEALRPGDAVLTRHGPGIKRVRWIGEQEFHGRFIAPSRAPVRICAGALGHGLPRRDLVVSPAHAVVVDGVLVDARLLVNGISVLRERVGEVVAYRHVDLGEHDCLLAEGAWAESYRETGDRRAFHNAATATERAVEPACLPHVCCADDPRLPALRARLDALIRRSA